MSKQLHCPGCDAKIGHVTKDGTKKIRSRLVICKNARNPHIVCPSCKDDFSVLGVSIKPKVRFEIRKS